MKAAYNSISMSERPTVSPKGNKPRTLASYVNAASVSNSYYI